jgi:hypothetical protein
MGGQGEVGLFGRHLGGSGSDVFRFGRNVDGWVDVVFGRMVGCFGSYMYESAI